MWKGKLRDFCTVSIAKKRRYVRSKTAKTFQTSSMDIPLPCEIIKGPLKGVNAKKEGTLSKPSVCFDRRWHIHRSSSNPFFPMVRLTIVKVSRKDFAITYLQIDYEQLVYDAKSPILQSLVPSMVKQWLGTFAVCHVKCLSRHANWVEGPRPIFRPYPLLDSECGRMRTCTTQEMIGKMN